MSFLKKVLSTHCDIEVSKAVTQLEDISKNINQIKQEVFTYLQERYVEFEPFNDNDKALIFQCEQLSSDIEKITSQIESVIKPEIQDAEAEVDELKKVLQETDFEYRMCAELIELHSNLKNCDVFCEEGQCREALESLEALNIGIENAMEGVKKLDVFEAMKTKAIKARSKLFALVTNLFNDTLEMVAPNGNQAGGLKLNMNTFDDFQVAFLVMHQMKITISGVAELGFYLQHNIFNPVIRQQTTVEIENTKMGHLKTITVTIKNEKTPFYKDVLRNIEKVIQFLANFLDIPIDDSISLLSLLGAQIGTEFAQMLIDDCLEALVPQNVEEMNDFAVIGEQIKLFVDMLTEKNFLSVDHENSGLLIGFIESVPIKYSNHVYNTVMKKSETIMKKDLHSMVEVELNDLSELEFKKCQVSNSCIEFVNYMFETMDLAVQGTGSVQIAISVRDAINLYYKGVPKYHQKLLETIPQQVAIFFNNCQYIAYKLLILKAKYYKTLTEVLEDGPPIEFDDVINGLQKTADNLFKNQLKTQKDQILNIIKESDLSNLGNIAEFDIKTEKSIRQCLRQLELLQTVWKKVLPTDIYDKSLGFLLNSLVEDLIETVVNVEDLSAAASKQLVTYYTLIQQRAPKVFTEPNEIHRHVKSWGKLNEIIFLLESNLYAIDERWADGKGPLAVAFLPEELKKIIRALFQNTDRRATLLNKIK